MKLILRANIFGNTEIILDEETQTTTYFGVGELHEDLLRSKGALKPGEPMKDIIISLEDYECP